MVDIILKNIALSFYPIGININSEYEKYLQTFECNNLINTLNEVFSADSTQKIREDLLDEFKKISLLKDIEDMTLESFDKCLTFKIDFLENDTLYQLYANISVLVPYYYVYVLKNNIKLEPYLWVNTPTRDQTSENTKFQKHLHLISEVIEKQISFIRFPDFLLSKVIPDISYSDIESGNFTYFNAFFLNDLNL